MFYFIAFGLNCQCYLVDISGTRIFIGEVNPVCSERDKSSLNNAYLGNVGGPCARRLSGHFGSERSFWYVRRMHILIVIWNVVTVNAVAIYVFL